MYRRWHCIIRVTSNVSYCISHVSHVYHTCIITCISIVYCNMYLMYRVRILIVSVMYQVCILCLYRHLYTLVSPLHHARIIRVSARRIHVRIDIVSMTYLQCIILYPGQMLKGGYILIRDGYATELSEGWPAGHRRGCPRVPKARIHYVSPLRFASVSTT